MKSFGCFSPKTRGFLVGVFELIGGIVGFIFTILPILDLTDFENKYKIDKAGSEDKTTENMIREHVLLRVRLFKILYFAAMIIFCVQIIFSLVVIHAIWKKSRVVLKVWMVVKTIFIVISVIILTVMCINKMLNPATIIFSTLMTVLYIFHVKVFYGLKDFMNPEHERIEDELLP